MHNSVAVLNAREKGKFHALYSSPHTEIYTHTNLRRKESKHKSSTVEGTLCMWAVQSSVQGLSPPWSSRSKARTTKGNHHRQWCLMCSGLGDQGGLGKQQHRGNLVGLRDPAMEGRNRQGFLNTKMVGGGDAGQEGDQSARRW